MVRLVAWALLSVEMTAGLAASTANDVHRTALRAFAHELHESLHELLPTDDDATPVEEVEAQVDEYMRDHFQAEPLWANQSQLERTENVHRHYSRGQGPQQQRRLQAPWSNPLWRDESQHAQAESVAATLGPTSTACNDALATNFGEQTSCAYDCQVLQDEYFPQPQAQTTRCFLFDPNTNSWPEVGGSAELLAMRQQRQDIHTFASVVEDGATRVLFSVGNGRECRNVTIVSTFQEIEADHVEVVCLMDGEHEYNHTIEDQHSVEVVGYANSGVHAGSGGTTSFVIGECTDILIRVTTTLAGGGPITWTLDDNRHNGPWTFETPADIGVHEYPSCMFDNDFTLTRQSDVTWQGTVEVVGFIHFHNTIVIPTDENWIVQGIIDPSSGLPSNLDGRLSSGSEASPSSANIVLRHVRISSQTAPVNVDEMPGNLKGRTGGSGGAFKYDGGSSDMTNPVRITFIESVFDHNQASVDGGAVTVNGRGGMVVGDSPMQTWASGITLTILRCTFFANWAGYRAGAIDVWDAWPLLGTIRDTEFIQNHAMIFFNFDFRWDAISEMMMPRVGEALLVVDGCLLDGGYAETGALGYVGIASAWVSAGTVNEPDALWTVKFQRSTIINQRTLIAPCLWFNVYPLAPPDAHYRLDTELTDLYMADIHGLRDVGLAGILVLSYPNQGTQQVIGSRFERNGAESSLANGGFIAAGPTGGAFSSTFAFERSHWSDNTAGRGAAISVAAGQYDMTVRGCIFQGNVACEAGGAISIWALPTATVLIEATIFQQNAVRPPPSLGGVDVVVLLNTGRVGLGTRLLADGEYMAPVWRVDNGPVRGISSELCELAEQTAQLAEVSPEWPVDLVCANRTYLGPGRTYSEVMSLTAGTHTLWVGRMSMMGTRDIGWGGGWIEVVGRLGPLLPVASEERPTYFPGCMIAGATCSGFGMLDWPDSSCCPKGWISWDSYEFEVSEGFGGAVLVDGPADVVIRDSTFSSNEAAKGTALSFTQVARIRMTNSTISTAEEESASTIRLIASQVDTCIENPCSTGSRCTFAEHSTRCDDCAENEVGTDGISCTACPPGTSPDGLREQCLPCAPGQYSGIGICFACDVGKTSSADFTGCIPCEPGTFRGPGQQQCEPCAAGSQPDTSAASCAVCMEPGTFSDDGTECKTCEQGKVPTSSRSGCTVCPPGFQPNAQLSGCASCAVESINAVSADGTECQECPARMEPNSHLTDCFCKRGTYDTKLLGVLKCHGPGTTALASALNDQCVVCDDCLDCSERSVTKLRNGWAVFGVGQMYQCPVADGCPQKALNNVNSTYQSACAVGYEGPICGNCDQPDWHHLRVGNPCNPCDDGRVDVPLLLGIIFGAVTISIIVVSGVINQLDDDGIITDFRILIGFYQILAQASGVLDIRLPYPVPDVVDFLKLLFGEWRAVVKMDCWQLGGFYGKLWMNLAVMPIVVAGICVAIFFAQRKTLQTVIAAGAADDSAMETLKIKLIHNLFLAIFLVYPTITATLFRVPQCRTLGDESFHEEDYNIDCSSTKYYLVLGISVLLILLIPIGVPGLFLFYMRRAKDKLGFVNTTNLGGAKLSPDDVIDKDDRYGFLISDYRPKYWYYEIVAYSRKLILGGVSVVMGRGTMAQTYFVATVEAFYLMHHMRTYPFVSTKHNTIEALGHCSLLLLYAITLILRNDNESHWEQEWFPKRGYGWFIIFLFLVVLPAPTVYYWRAEANVNRTQASELGEIDSMETDNPLVPSAEEDPDSKGPDFAAATMPRSRLAKLQRDAKDAQTARKQVEKLKKEISQLRRQSGQSNALQQADCESDGVVDGPRVQEMEVDALKKIVDDASLTEETRKAAQVSLQDHLAAQFDMIRVQAQKNKSAAYAASLQAAYTASLQVPLLGTSDSPEEANARAEMFKWILKQRLRRHHASIVRVAGPDALPYDLIFLSEEDLKELSDEMTTVESVRFTTALQALQSDGPQAVKPELEPS